MPDLDSLIQRYLEGVLSADEAEAMLGLIEANPKDGERLLRHLEMDVMLRASKGLTNAGMRAPVLLPKRRFTVTTLAGVAAVAACVALVGGWIGSGLVDATRDEGEVTTASVAVLTRAVNLEWESPAIAAGTPLAPGLLKLKSGLAQIEFYQGARVLIEGPAEFELVSAGEATCTRGRLSAQVPPQAKGFRINTPRGTVVDLGTEFGLDVSSGTSEVHVFKGEVELHPLSDVMRSLKEGQALSYANEPMALSANPAGFASLGEMDSKAVDSQRMELERWKAKSRILNEDSALKLRFDFQDRWGSRSLMNQAVAVGREGDGSIVGGEWTQGRWPGKGALEFRNVSDRVRLSVPGETKALTLAACVRINGLDRMFNSLFMSEGWGGRKVHWQIKREGLIRLGVAGSDGNRHEDYDTPVFFTPERFGRWVQIAVVFDPTAKEVRHYAEGELIARLTMKDATPLKIGIAELGNWNDSRTKGGVAIRHLSGAIDEFALWDRVLSGEELALLAR